MYTEERKAEILKLLERDGKVSVFSLAKKFKTSQETIRRDLNYLEKKGALSRTHGGAISCLVKDGVAGGIIKEYPESIRRAQQQSEKQLISAEMAGHISDGDTIYIDNSTTCLFLIDALPKDIHINVITNSIRFLYDAAQLECENISFICIGGAFNPRNMSTYQDGMIASTLAADIFPDKCIISCAGINDKRGITDGSAYEVSQKRKYMEAADKVYLLIDHTKIGKTGQFALDDGSGIDCIITDEPIDKKKLKLAKNIEVIVAK